jgi:mannitol/fructose-specific phosphotransferase system IIA component (Ntr-type)
MEEAVETTPAVLIVENQRHITNILNGIYHIFNNTVFAAQLRNTPEFRQMESDLKSLTDNAKKLLDSVK